MRKYLLAAALAWIASPSLAQQASTALQASAPPALVAPPDYARGSAWLCLPGRADACGRPLPTANLLANGYGPVASHVPAAAPGFDCFYVYPTVSRDAGDNSDLVAGIEEQATAMVQFARFAGVCRPFAPIHRQATITALLRGIATGAPRSLEPAYEDVRAAWRYYLANHNRGRPFVLIGHSQGTIHLIRLLASEIEGRPEAGRMLSAILVGFNVEVPEGQVVGGTFRSTPLCRRPGEIGCVITFVSFRAESPPPAGALFGRAARPGMTIGCTSPARLAGRGNRLDSIFFAAPQTVASGPAIIWSSAGAPPAPFLRAPRLVSGRCLNRGSLGYLAIDVNNNPRDARTDEIPGAVRIGGQILPAWGLHTADMNLVLGDLIAAVALQHRAFGLRR